LIYSLVRVRLERDLGLVVSLAVIYQPHQLYG
jgi:hypothetical protein